ncbi:MAG: hypothetical protein WC679_00060 [Bacteroidales bacterium]|jgi:hypothetical protein
MAQSYFEVEKGLLFEGVTILPTSGVPNGAAFDTAGVGSVAMDTSVGHIYRKILVGSGSDKWERSATATDIANIAIQTDWRESVLTSNLIVTTLPTGTATQTITVDSIVVDDNDRVLFANLTANPNVYIYNKATGLFVEDTNLATAGDTIYIEQGTNAGRTMTFNYLGVWVLTGQTSLDEEGYIRAFIGKSGTGNTLPTYTSTFHVANNDSLTAAISKLDTAIDAVENPALTGQYFGNTDSLNTIVEKLDTALATTRTLTTATSVTTAAVIDSVSVDTWDAVKWLVVVKGNANNALKQLVEINAIHDGKATADATTADYTVFSKLKLGEITGLTYSVELSGTGVSQSMQLKIASTTAVDVEAIRTIL